MDETQRSQLQKTEPINFICENLFSNLLFRLVF